MLLLVCLSDCVCLSLCYLFYCVTMGLYPIQINGMEYTKADGVPINAAA